MKNGRRNTLNFEADKRFGDPTAVSDPACWLPVELAQSLSTQIPNFIGTFRHGIKYQVDRGLDISSEVVIGNDGKLHLKMQSN
ncbi:MAG: hypothetical protein Q7T57_01660 [Dehalococcoidales bacterium]|nr:hypothetical protein [Dehalococcoidales bacterium]